MTAPKIQVRNTNLEIVAQIKPDSIEWRKAWMDLTGWILTVSLPRIGDPYFFDRSAAISALLAPGSGVVVEDETGVLMSGSANLTEDGTSTAFTRETRIDEATGVIRNLITVSGRLDIAAINDRLAAPDPTHGLEGAHYEYDIRTGAASSVVYDLITVNAAAQATPERQTFGLEVPFVGDFGNTITSAARWPNLLTHLRELCIAGDVTVDVTQKDTSLVATIAPVRDRSDVVIFSEDARTMQGAKIDSTTTTATTVLVAGQGEGTARQVVEVDNDNAIRRIERFLDRRDVETEDELRTAGETWLKDNGGVVALTVDPDLNNDAALFGVDFELGDLVGVAAVSGGPTSVQRVAAVDVKITQNRVDRALTLGAVLSLDEDVTLSRVDSLAARVSRLETTT